MALSHFIQKPGNSWQDSIWPCFLYKAHNIPNKAYFGHVSLQELWVSHFNWIPETYDAYVALGIYNQVEFIILCQANQHL